MSVILNYLRKCLQSFFSPDFLFKRFFLRQNDGKLNNEFEGSKFVKLFFQSPENTDLVNSPYCKTPG